MARLATAVALVLGTCAPTPAPTIPPAATSTVPPAVSTSGERAAASPSSGPPPATGSAALQTGRASWYARGRWTASGERFNPDGLSFAHRSMAFGTLVRFCRGEACVVARCTDRGPAAWTRRDFDLSRGAFRALAPLSAGVVVVTWSVVG